MRVMGFSDQKSPAPGFSADMQPGPPGKSKIIGPTLYICINYELYSFRGTIPIGYKRFSQANKNGNFTQDNSIRLLVGRIAF